MEKASLSPSPVETPARQKPSGTKRIKISRACDECRKRKVKCDGAQPCYRCRKSDTLCVFAKVAPRRGPPKQYVELLETRLRMVEKALSLLEKSNQDQATANLDEEPQASWDQPQYDPAPSDLYNEVSGPMSIGNIGQAMYIDDQYTQDYHLLEQSLPSLSDTPMLASLTAIPQELIDTYFEHVHPQLPMIHKPSFIGRWTDRNTGPSLLLLNAMCAVAAIWHHPPVQTVGPAGIQFYQRAFYLIDEYADTPRISTVQALLLLIKYQEYHRRPGFFCRPSLYIQMVVQMCNDLGLMYKYSADTAQLESGKPTFWIAYIYDVMISIEQGREPGFADLDLTAEEPIISSDDDEAEILLVEHHRWMFQLMKILGSTLKFVRLLASRRQKPSSQPNKRQSLEENARFLTCRVSLENFLQSLPSSLVYIPSNCDPSYPSAKDAMPSSFTAFLHMTYHLAVIVLHRAYTMYPLSPVQDLEVAYPHREICAASASHITNIVSTLVSIADPQKFIRHIRGAQHTIHCLTAAITVHSYLMTVSNTEEMAQTAKEQYELSLALLRDLAMESPSLEFQSRFREAELTLLYGQMAVNPTSTIGSPHEQATASPTSTTSTPKIPPNKRQSKVQKSRRNSGPAIPMHTSSRTQRSPSNIPMAVPENERRMNTTSPQPTTAPLSMLMQSSAQLMGSDAANRFAAIFQQPNASQWRGYQGTQHQQQHISGQEVDPNQRVGSRFLHHLQSQQFQRPIYDDVGLQTAMNSPVPMRTQSATYRLGGSGRSATWSQGTAPNMYQFQPQRPTSQLQNSVAASDPMILLESYSHQMLPSEGSPTISRSPNSLSMSGNNLVGPTPSRTTSTPRATPYTTQRRPATIGHHRRHTISNPSKQALVDGMVDEKLVTRRRGRGNTRSQLLSMTYGTITEDTAQGTDCSRLATSGSSSSPSSFSASSDTPSGLAEDSEMTLDPASQANDNGNEIKVEDSMMRYLMDEQDIQWENPNSG